MNFLVDLVNVKIWVVEISSLEKDALHIYAALFTLLGSCLIFRWRASQFKPLLLVLFVLFVNEAVDIEWATRAGEAADINASLHDIWNTMLAPLLIFAGARFTKIFTPPAPRSAPHSTETEASGDEP